MKTNKPSLFLYLFASIFAVIGIVIENDLITLLMKPMIVPAILYYYIQVKKGKINWLFLIILVSSFTSDMLVLFDLPNGNIPIALLNMFCYLIFINFAIKDISLKYVSNIKFFYFALIVIGCFIILYDILGLMSGLDDFSNNLYIIYGIVLCVLASIIGFNHLNQESNKTFYALIMCICFITTDVFYAVYNFFINLEVFLILNVTVQFASYYYMVKYITCNSEIEEVL
jgi:hypothetical protein